MAEMGKYCKAYQVKDLREFARWSEDHTALRADASATDPTPARTTLSDDDILYIQENYVVTDGIFKDEHVVFSDVTEEWKTFCHDTLEFEIPTWEDDPRASVETTS